MGPWRPLGPHPRPLGCADQSAVLWGQNPGKKCSLLTCALWPWPWPWPWAWAWPWARPWPDFGPGFALPFAQQLASRLAYPPDRHRPRTHIVRLCVLTLVWWGPGPILLGASRALALTRPWFWPWLSSPWPWALAWTLPGPGLGPGLLALPLRAKRAVRTPVWPGPQPNLFCSWPGHPWP